MPPDGCKKPVVNQERKDGGGGSGSGNGSSGPEHTVMPKSKVSDKEKKNSKGTKIQSTRGGRKGPSMESVKEDLLEVCWTAVAGTVLKAGDAQSSRNGQVSSAPDVKPSAASAPTGPELPARPRTVRDETPEAVATFRPATTFQGSLVKW